MYWIRSVSVPLSTLLIVAVAVGLSAAVTAYLVNYFGFVSGKTEGIRVYPDSYLQVDYKGGEVCGYLHLYANYKPSIGVEKVLLHGIEQSSSAIAIIEQGDASISDNVIVLYDGFLGWIEVCWSSLAPGDVHADYLGKVEVNIMSSEGFLYKAALEVKNINK